MCGVRQRLTAAVSRCTDLVRGPFPHKWGWSRSSAQGLSLPRRGWQHPLWR
uniref:Uncharacterized protein n=1 Tax=uncultured marine virus TaxID=186617 RepID=A0A0F7L2W7_9VIRU|nr:hypothetical protein [uncultured marine virus]